MLPNYDTFKKMILVMQQIDNHAEAHREKSGIRTNPSLSMFTFCSLNPKNAMSKIS